MAADALGCHALQEGAAATGGWGALLKRRYRRIMVLASSLPIWQQASGINTVVFYSSDVRRLPPLYPSLHTFTTTSVFSCGDLHRTKKALYLRKLFEREAA